MTEGPSIRRFSIDRYDDLISLWDLSGLPYKMNGRDSRSSIESEIKDERCHFLLAFDGPELVGSVIATHDGRKGWINRLAVHPDHRMKGLARTLLEEAEKRLSDQGVGIFACLIEGWNGSSVDVFEHLGYSEFKGVKYFTKRACEDI